MIINNQTPNTLTFLDGGFSRSQRPSVISFIQDEIDTYNLRSYKQRLVKIGEKASYNYDIDNAKDNFIQTLVDADNGFGSRAGISLPESRITQGIKAGLIDYAVGALTKIGDHWIDLESKQTLLETEISGFIQSKGVELVPVVTRQLMADFDESGVISIGDNVIATKIDEPARGLPTWQIANSETTVKGSAERVLSHASVPFITPEKLSSEEIWHGTLSSSKNEINSAKSAMSSSRRGVGLYGTMSMTEAATIYANPFHHMTREKRFTYGDAAIETEDYGHLVKLGSTDKTTPFVANWSNDAYFKSVLNTPSPFLIQAICNNFRNEAPESMSKRIDKIELTAVSNIFEAQSNYELYMAIDTLSSDLLSVDNKAALKLGAPIANLFQSLGYDTLEITPPTPAELKKIFDTKLAVINDVDYVHDLAKDNGVAVKHLVESIEHLAESVRVTTPKNLDQGHVIFFDNNTAPEFSESLGLPTHNSILGISEANPRESFDPHYDSFYDSENKNMDRFDPWVIGVIDSTREKSIAPTQPPKPSEKPRPRPTLNI